MNPPPTRELLDLLQGITVPPKETPGDIKEPEHLSPEVVTLMMDLHNDPDVPLPPQRGIKIPWRKANQRQREGRSQKRHAGGRRNEPLEVKEISPADVALWIALGYENSVIAERLGCSVTTIGPWLNRNKEVREAARLIRKELMDRVEGSVVDKAGSAVTKLAHLMDNSPEEEIQMRSAKILLDKAFELRPEKVKGPLVTVNAGSQTLDLTNIPSQKLREILAEELAARNGSADGNASKTLQEAPSCPPEGSDGVQQPLEAE